MAKTNLRFDFWTIITITLVALFTLFLVYPLASLFINSFRVESVNGFTLDNFTKFFSKKYYYRSQNSHDFHSHNKYPWKNPQI